MSLRGVCSHCGTLQLYLRRQDRWVCPHCPPALPLPEWRGLPLNFDFGPGYVRFGDHAQLVDGEIRPGPVNRRDPNPYLEGYP